MNEISQYHHAIIFVSDLKMPGKSRTKGQVEVSYVNLLVQKWIFKFDFVILKRYSKRFICSKFANVF
jgi:hypothetical protein